MNQPSTNLAAPADAMAATAVPDWSTLPHDVTCPLCDYNLRGLAEPRCPECGYISTWPTLLDADRHLHPYLFEHHPERNTRSFLRTLAGGFAAQRFWETLAATHTLRPRRLTWYYIVTVVLTLLPFPLFFAVQLLHNYLSPLTATPIYFFLYPSHLWRVVIVMLAYAAWPWVMLLTLMVYRRSMGRASVRSGHLARCVIYAWDAAAWLGLIATALTLLPLWTDVAATGVRVATPSDSGLFRLMNLYAFAWFLLTALATHRLIRAYTLYLKMPRAWFAIPLATIVLVLFYWNVLMLVGQALRL